jgi:biotin transport system substrate-specific component
MRPADAHLLAAVRPIDDRRLAVVEVLAVAGAILLGAWAKVYVPWTPVPITLQTLPVLASAFVVGRARATWGILTYLFAGLLYESWQPDRFSLFAAFGPSVGYLIAFALVPFAVTAVRRPLIGIVLATILIYTFGATWLAIWNQLHPLEAVSKGILPFLPGDAMKGALAYLVARYSLRGGNPNTSPPDSTQ